jgi:phage baseplate assembly protein W
VGGKLVAEMMVPAFTFPLQLAGSDFAVREQDSTAEVVDCVSVLLLTPVGSRIAVPQYGVPETVDTQQPVVHHDLVAAIRQWEPRATVLFTESPDLLNQLIARVQVIVTGGSA